MRPFRFLASAAPGPIGGRELADLARRAESLGYDALVLPDHLVDQHAPVPVLASIAAVTDRIRVGTFVLNAGLRHPAVLAQDLATLDVLSGGRLEIGIDQFAQHYNGWRPHRSLDLAPPRTQRPVVDLHQQRIKRRPVLGGLINEYERAA